MKFRIIETTQKKATSTLIKELRGRMFHVTSPAAFIKICESGAILSNSNGSFKFNWTENYYFKNQNCVSVVDLVNNTRPRVTRKKLISDYSIFEQAFPIVVFLFLSPTLHPKAITWQNGSQEEFCKQKIVEELESGIPSHIPLEEIEETWFITLKDRVALKSRLDEIYASMITSTSQKAAKLAKISI